jgi:dATP pyrophosphohydrolase
MRTPFQVLILPYRRGSRGIEYAILRRADLGWWQFVSGGGEDDETPLQAAEREVAEETGMDARGRLSKLDTISSVPKDAFDSSHTWGDDIYVLPEHCFAIDVGDDDVSISAEHTEIRWVHYEEARERLEWEGNRTALWELSQRLARGGQDESI